MLSKKRYKYLVDDYITMFEYFLAGFTGTFFSYFCVYWAGIESYSFAVDSVSDRLIRKMESKHDILIRNSETNYKALNNKMDEIMHKLDNYTK